MEARAHAEARGESGEGRGGGGARSRSAPDMRARTYDAPRGWGGDSRMARTRKEHLRSPYPGQLRVRARARDGDEAAAAPR